MLRNMKLKTKFIKGYLLLCVIMLIVGGVGLYNAGMLKKQANVTYDDVYQGVSLIGDIAIEVGNIRVDMQKITDVAMSKDINSNGQLASESFDKIHQLLSAYEATSHVEEDLKNLNEKLKPAITAYEEFVTKIISLEKEGNIEEALKIYEDKTTRVKVDEAVTEMTEFNDDYIYEIEQQATELKNTAIIITCAMISVGIVFALLLGLFLASQNL